MPVADPAAARDAMLARMFSGERFLSADLQAIGVSHGLSIGLAAILANKITQGAKRRREIVQLGNRGPAYVWQAASAREVAPAIIAPHVGGPLDPPTAIEGKHSGLTEGLADRLWRRIGGGNESDEMRTTADPMVADAWRRVALDAIGWLLELGMRGPGQEHEPREWVPGWSYDCLEWAIYDGDKGCVCLVPNVADVPLLLAAPRMDTAIRAVLARVEAHGGVKRQDLEDLRAALPEVAAPVEQPA